MVLCEIFVSVKVSSSSEAIEEDKMFKEELKDAIAAQILHVVSLEVRRGI